MPKIWFELKNKIRLLASKTIQYEKLLQITEIYLKITSYNLNCVMRKRQKQGEFKFYILI